MSPTENFPALRSYLQGVLFFQTGMPEGPERPIFSQPVVPGAAQGGLEKNSALRSCPRGLIIFQMGMPEGPERPIFSSRSSREWRKGV